MTDSRSSSATAIPAQPTPSPVGLRMRMLAGHASMSDLDTVSDPGPALVRGINSNTLAILISPRAISATCGNAEAFRALPPVHPRKQDPPRKAPAQQRNVTTATRPCPCWRPLLFRQYPQLNNGSRSSAAMSGGGCPARLIAAAATSPTSHTHLGYRLRPAGARDRSFSPDRARKQVAVRSGWSRARVVSGRGGRRRARPAGRSSPAGRCHAGSSRYQTRPRHR